MKRCPTCFRTYGDETLTFCLADGSLLSAPYDTEVGIHHSDSAPTEVMPRGESFEGALPTVPNPLEPPPTIPARPLMGYQSDAGRGQYFSEERTVESGQSELLIPPGERASRALLYILMRVMVGLLGSLMTYMVFTTSRRMGLSYEIFWGMRISQRFFVGVLLVAGQLALLRKYLRPMWAWVVLTLTAVVITSFIDFIVFHFLLDLLLKTGSDFLENTVWPVLLEINGALPWLLVALAQWLIIQRRARRAWLWVAMTIVAIVIVIFTDKMIDSLGLPTDNIINYLLSGPTAGFILGTLQAVALLLFLKKSPRQTPYS